ncbi:16S rRNA (cytosine1402-N4)-methyltransferase [Anaeroplasma bactoclasticum]|jgi:16S rRNA (cytosine1402-N4)-methyltransferase|uniref:Ribosomal RNA small subunit methyltransferase H n=1 Tax=Anaeroplasma bactoclasticum TaxID=2088 RepID=A0A397QV16_9MOLU|nr:16S rRNA (cytosine(1402)-N(4))-methyltransferase RsmH [Anaeroplasma bactoclasticum]RIA64746.1 16S rRNA (cytosine1402-N4)-methyltransferase [Anaeroplasma bactoclasticum]
MYVHKSVLLNEAIEGLNIKPDGIYVDATTGGGGHSSHILSKLTTGHLYCFDQDEYAYKRSKEVLDPISKDNYTFIPSNFVNVKSELNKLGVTKIDGILYDLGVSSFQFDIPERGFSYNYDAPLDMRMNQNQELTAEIIVNTWSFNDLMRIFTRYGEDPFSKQIARAIERERAIKPIHTTFELVDVIKSALPAKVLSKKGHPAKQTFQALRIAVNDELKVFEVSINDALDMLAPKGRAVVITFHSLEDRICKTVFKERSTVDIPKGVPLNIEAPYELITRKPVTASEEELKENNRAHSAKMRIIEKK